MEVTPELSINAQEDRKLVHLAKEGDMAAFEKLVRKYQKSVYYTLKKMVYNSDDAEDLTQEAFAKAYAALSGFDPKYGFAAWLFRIATNNCIDFIRKKRLNTVSIDAPYGKDEDDGYRIEVKDHAQIPDDPILKEQRAKYLETAINRLPDKRLIEVVRLRYFKEYSYDEIAQEMNLPMGTVKGMLFRAKSFLTQELKNVIKDI